uniref:U-metritoxin-Msn1a n=1 Tax=Metridium senile TaxID=6116 RepID=K1B_METSE|nr:RecName: Full=U-metritoxin-Msn1a; Short=U-MTTX-Msn1a; AltName: Full=Metridin [Metridium senile]prf//1311344A metridin [Metridium senile]
DSDCKDKLPACGEYRGSFCKLEKVKSNCEKTCGVKC